jgi:hypothetical protein
VSEASKYPIALAYLEIGELCWRWRVPNCPFHECVHGHHIHGGGEFGIDPRNTLNHRAHVGTRGYLLTDAFPGQTEDLISSFRLGRQSRRLY